MAGAIATFRVSWRNFAGQLSVFGNAAMDFAAAQR
jgi:hypothetical protein